MTTPERKREYQLEYVAKNKARIYARNKAYYERNKAAIVERSKRNYKEWAKANPGRISELKRNYANVRRYGITPDQYDAMFLAQDGKCAICMEPWDGATNRRRLAIDHDHETGKVRQLLCTNCNAMVGHARENIANLRAAIAYLGRHGKGSA